MTDFASQQNLEGYTDAELQQMVCTGNDSAFDEICRRYLPLIHSISARYYASGLERNDFVQEGLLALLSACKRYDAEKGSSFRNFAALCISRRFLSLIRSLNAKGIIPAESLVPIEEVEISDHNRHNPETLVLEQERHRDLKKKIKNTLTEYEHRVLELYLTGNSYRDIADALGVTQKSIDNALQRIRRKLAGL